MSTWSDSIAARRAWLNVSVPHTAEFLIVTIADHKLIVMEQVPDKSRGTVAAGCQKILDTIALGP